MPPKAKKAVSTVRCPKGSRKNSKTGKCIPKNVNVPKSTGNTSMCATVKCSRDKICNPNSGKCVLRTGAIGKKLLDAMAVVKKVDKKIEHLQHDPRVSEDIKHHIEDLASADPQVREHAKEILIEEIKTKPSVWQYLSEYIKQLAKIRPYLPYIMTGLVFAGTSLIHFTGTSAAWSTWMRTASGIGAQTGIDIETGKIVPHVKVGKYVYNKATYQAQNTLSRIGFKNPTFQRIDEIIKLLDSSGTANIGSLLTEAWEKLNGLICQNKEGFTYVHRIVKKLNMLRKTLQFQGNDTGAVNAWITSFNKVGVECPI